METDPEHESYHPGNRIFAMLSYLLLKEYYYYSFVDAMQAG